jgi:muramoyltetrapeptide carboxypeptidase LdcA involved in peptidoglycan recycling
MSPQGGSEIRVFKYKGQKMINRVIGGLECAKVLKKLYFIIKIIQ